jgi:hypothetical protein
MQKLINTVFLFHIINILVLLIINNIYDWQGGFNLIALPMYIVPNAIGLVLNLCIFFLIQKIITNEKIRTYILLVFFFIINEFSYFLYEKKIVFFGLFQTEVPSNIIQVDNNYYLFVSISALFSAIIVIYINMFSVKR